MTPSACTREPSTGHLLTVNRLYPYPSSYCGVKL